MAEEIDIPKITNTEQAPEPLESDLSHIAGEVAKHRENPEMSGASDQEMVKHAIRSMAPPPAPSPQSNSSDDSVLPSYMNTATPAAKLEVEDLLRTAFKEGVSKATADARKSNPFILDAFHDVLAGKLHEELVKRKMI